MILLSHDAFDVINGTLLKPTTPEILSASPSADQTAAYNTLKDEYDRQLKVFTKMDSIAHIVTSIERQPMTDIFTCESAKAMWNKLHEIYEVDLMLVSMFFNKNVTACKKILPTTFLRTYPKFRT